MRKMYFQFKLIAAESFPDCSGSFSLSVSRFLIVHKPVHENEDGSLDISLEFNGDFKDMSTVCFEINE